MEGEKIENRPTHPGELVWFSRSIGVQRMRRRTTTVPHWSELLCHLLQNNGCIMIPFMGYLARYPSIKTHYGLMVTRTCPFNIQTYVWCVWKLKERNVSAWPLKCNSGYLKIWWVSKSAVSKVWVNLRRAQIKPLKRGDRQTQHMYSEVIPRRRQERSSIHPSTGFVICGCRSLERMEFIGVYLFLIFSYLRNDQTQQETAHVAVL